MTAPLRTAAAASAGLLAGLGASWIATTTAGSPGDRAAAVVEEEPGRAALPRALQGPRQPAARPGSPDPRPSAQGVSDAILAGPDGSWTLWEAHLLAQLSQLPPGDLPVVVAAVHTASGYPETRLATAALRLWAEDDPAGAASWVLEFTLDRMRLKGFYRVVFGAWGKSDPEAALAALPQIEDGELQSTAADALFLGWASVDAAAAAEQARPYLQGEDGVIGRGGKILGWIALTDPAAATAAWADLPEAKKRSAAADLALTWAESSPGAALAALEWVLGLPPGYVTSAVSDAAARAWAEAAPERSLARIAGSSLPEGVKDTISEKVVRAWASRAPTTAIRYLLRSDAGKRRQKLLLQAADAVARSDPKAAAAAIDGLLPGSARTPSLAAYVAARWAEADLPSALSWAEALDDGDAAAAALARLARENAGHAPQWFVQRIASMAAGPHRNEAAAALAQGWPVDELGSAFDWAGDLPEGPVRQAVYQALTKRMAEWDPGAAIDRLDSLPPQLRSDAVRQIAAAIRRDDPRAAIDWLGRNGESGGVAEWFDADPEAAADYLRGLPDDKVRSLGSAEFGAFARHDPEAAFALLAKVGLTRRFVSRLNLDSLSEEDPTRAAAIVEPIEDESARRTALSIFITSWAKVDPRAAAAGLSDWPHEKERGYPIRSLARTWAADDPEAAAAWAAALPDEKARASAHSAIAGRWSWSDPWAASVWIDSLGPGDARDGAVEQLVRAIQKEDPAGAFDWAATLPPGPARAKPLHGVVEAWMKTDPEAARTAVEEAALSPEERETVARAIAEE